MYSVSSAHRNIEQSLWDGIERGDRGSYGEAREGVERRVENGLYIEAARGRYAKIDVEFAWYIGRWEGKGICKERVAGLL